MNNVLGWLVLAGLIVVSIALHLRFGWKACACRSRLTIQMEAEPSFDTHKPMVYLFRNLSCLRCKQGERMKIGELAVAEYWRRQDIPRRG